ncbi:hypothetical protein pdam_00013281, partial [Pocillopora damicornis]
WITQGGLLGVDIDDKLGWSNHIKGLLKSFVNFLNLYFKVIIPAVAYAISVWGGTIRNSPKIEIPLFKSNSQKISISYRRSICWNHLLIKGRKMNSVKSFSRKIKKPTFIRVIDFSHLLHIRDF